MDLTYFILETRVIRDFWPPARDDVYTNARKIRIQNPDPDPDHHEKLNGVVPWPRSTSGEIFREIHPVVSDPDPESGSDPDHHENWMESSLDQDLPLVKFSERYFRFFCYRKMSLSTFLWPWPWPLAQSLPKTNPFVLGPWSNIPANFSKFGPTVFKLCESQTDI